MTSILEARSIIKTFSQRGIETRVLRGIDMSVEKGEFLILMGRSGAGKSTLLYQVSLLDKPTSGSVTILGKNVLEYSDAETTEFRLRNFGFVFQDYALIPELTALENVMIPLLMQGVVERDARDRAMAALEQLGLAERAHAVPSKLSGGQQQRVSIARAVVTNPHILFADEPTANLDSVSAAAVMELISQINDQGTTVIMVTHEEDVSRRADRIIYLDDGLIVSERRVRS